MLMIIDCQGAFCLRVDFSIFSQLQAVSFDVPMHSLWDLIYVEWIPELLSQIKSPHMRSIEFNVWLDKLEGLDRLDWNWMSNAFQRPPFLALRMVRFCVRGRLDPSAVEVTIKQRLTNCDARGIVYVECPFSE